MYVNLARSKEPKQSLSSTRQHRFTTDSDSRRFHFPAGQNHIRRRQLAVQTDTLRGAMLVVVIVVTIVLYLMLLELERSSFASVAVDKPNLNQGVVVPVFPGSKAVLTRPDATSRAATVAAWPPLITRIAEEHDADDPAAQINDENTKLASFDTAYCNGECRFLLPVRIGEQESKSRIHFMQLIILARQLGRTIVLPNVGKSRMSACSKWPFGAYYDTNTFTHAGNPSDSWLAVDLERFSKWVDERPRPPNSFVVSLDSIHQDHRALPETRTGSEDALFVIESVEVDPKIPSCLEHKLARLRSSLPEMVLSMSFDGRSLKTESNFSTSTRLMKILSDTLDMDADADFDPIMGQGHEHTLQNNNTPYVSPAGVDVLVLDYDLRHPLFPTSTQPNFNLHYAPVLYDLADRVADNIGPFLGIHWRMESVPVQNLAWCAASLVSTLHTLLRDDATTKSTRYVWLATDHPRPLSAFVDNADPVVNDDWTLIPTFENVKAGKDGLKRKSSTFKSLSSEHDHAIRILVEAFQPGGDLDSWTLTDLAEQLRHYPYVEGKMDVDEALLDDPGVLGILDKLVIVEASAFVTGSVDCSKTSSFSKQVIEARQELLGAEHGRGIIRNVVEYFGKW